MHYVCLMNSDDGKEIEDPNYRRQKLPLTVADVKRYKWSWRWPFRIRQEPTIEAVAFSARDVTFPPLVKSHQIKLAILFEGFDKPIILRGTPDVYYITAGSPLTIAKGWEMHLS